MWDKEENSKLEDVCLNGMAVALAENKSWVLDWPVAPSVAKSSPLYFIQWLANAKYKD